MVYLPPQICTYQDSGMAWGEDHGERERGIQPVGLGDSGLLRHPNNNYLRILGEENE